MAKITIVKKQMLRKQKAQNQAARGRVNEKHGNKAQGPS